MISFAFILCSTLLLTSAMPQKAVKKADSVDDEGFDVVIKKIMSSVMQDVFSGKSMPESLLKRTMEEVEKQDGDVWKIIHNTLERVQDVQKGEGIDVVAEKVVRQIITKIGEKVKSVESVYDYLGKENVDELFGKLALRAEAYIKEKFGKKKN